MILIFGALNVNPVALNLKNPDESRPPTTLAELSTVPSVLKTFTSIFGSASLIPQTQRA